MQSDHTNLKVQCKDTRSVIRAVQLLQDEARVN